MITLPPIMVAPNGARRGKADHPALPITIEETVTTACACFDAGAGALHAHVRDADGAHVLDAGLYRELIAEMARRAPEMLVQITTEAVGRYTPEEQRAVVESVHPRAVSVALREMWPAPEEKPAATAFYRGCAERDIAVQHILYTPEEAERFAALAAAGDLPTTGLSAIFVLGRYDDGPPSEPEQIDRFLSACAGLETPLDWMVCAFGVAETACLGTALAKGGKARVGFENNLLQPDGAVAPDNAARVRAVAAYLKT